MGQTPTTWHYGLVARWWAEFNQDGPEIAYYRALIEESGGPALDVGCGTGRVLLPLLKAGLDVDGCDVSADMLALCRERAAGEGLSPRLFLQPMHELALSRRYQTIFVCGSFGIGGVRDFDTQALRRLYRQLAPRGVLALDHGGPRLGAAGLNRWIEQMAPRLPEPWPVEGDRKRAADGDELEMRSRLLAIDRDERIITRQIRVARWRAGEVAEEEEGTLRVCLYVDDELLGMLRGAGFATAEVVDGYVSGFGNGDQPVPVYLARK